MTFEAGRCTPFPGQEGPASRNKPGNQPQVRSKEAGGAQWESWCSFLCWTFSEEATSTPASHCNFSPLGNPTRSSSYIKITLHSYGSLQRKRGHLKRNFSTRGNISIRKELGEREICWLPLMENCVHTAIRMSKLFMAVNQRNRSSSDDPFQINIFSRNCTST